MTNEEAREQIDNLRAHCSDMARSVFTGGEVLWAKDVEALTQAIKALAQEPCEDAISRQAVDTLIDELARAISDERCYLPQRGRDTGAIMQNILDLPPVTPQPKTGHWNTYELAQGGINEKWLECSECMWSNALLIPRNYCPNCGCRMEGVE